MQVADLAYNANCKYYVL